MFQLVQNCAATFVGALASIGMGMHPEMVVVLDVTVHELGILPADLQTHRLANVVDHLFQLGIAAVLHASRSWTFPARMVHVAPGG